MSLVVLAISNNNNDNYHLMDLAEPISFRCSLWRTEINPNQSKLNLECLERGNNQSTLGQGKNLSEQSRELETTNAFHIIA